MRASIVHLLVALLIAVFAIGAPSPVQADCAKCQDCTTVVPAKNEAPCPQKGLACQIAQSCASQIQKVAAQFAFQDSDNARAVAFAVGSAFAVKSAFITPETAPPRL